MWKLADTWLYGPPNGNIGSPHHLRLRILIIGEADVTAWANGLVIRVGASYL
jgi:hypothetical protein